VQHAAFGVHLIELHPAGFRNAQPMPKHQEQQTTVAGFVPAALRRLDEPLNLAPGKVLAVAVIRPRVSCFAPAHHFVESSPYTTALNPSKQGRGLFNYRRNGTFCRAKIRVLDWLPWASEHVLIVGES